MIEQLYKEGYDAFIYEEKEVIHDEGGEPGTGAPYDEVRNAVHYRGVVNVGLFGYSHGAGSTYLLAKHMYELKVATPPRFAPYNLLFTGYIDGIQRGTATQAQVLRPPGSDYHLNQYQRNGTFVPGDPSPTMGDETIGDPADTQNENQSDKTIDGRLVVHVSIPNQEDVRKMLLATLRAKILAK